MWLLPKPGSNRRASLLSGKDAVSQGFRGSGIFPRLEEDLSMEPHEPSLPLSAGAQYRMEKPRREGAGRLREVLWGESEHPWVLYILSLPCFLKRS